MTSSVGLTITVPEPLGALGLTALAFLLIGWLISRRGWVAHFASLRRVYLATLACAEECIAAQDSRLEILERAQPMPRHAPL